MEGQLYLPLLNQQFPSLPSQGLASSPPLNTEAGWLHLASRPETDSPALFFVLPGIFAFLLPPALPGRQAMESLPFLFLRTLGT